MTALDDAPPQLLPPPALQAADRVPSWWESRELLANLTLREIRSKYKRTTLGHLWSLINPLAIMLMYTLVFSVILRSKPSTGHPSGLHVYALFLMSGLLAWSFFQNATVSGMTALITNANLLKKVYFRRDILVAAAALSFVVTFFIELGVLMAVLLGFGAMPLPWIPLLVVAVALLLLFALGLGLLLSVANVYFRDTEHFVNLLFLLWFYLTPVLYARSLVVKAFSHPHHLFGWRIPLMGLYDLNPMEHFVTVFRALLYDNTWPVGTDLVWCAGSALVTMSLGILVFRRFEARITEEL
jgi:lipopolysaccharide transport system permease protein